MSKNSYDFTIPTYVTQWLTNKGYTQPHKAMDSHIEKWYRWLKASTDFYAFDYVDTANVRRRGHRMSIKPAKRVCAEWASLLLNDKTEINCQEQTCTDYLNAYLQSSGFVPMAQELVERAFALGTGAVALWLNPAESEIAFDIYDARMMIPLSWDRGGITECAFCTQASIQGEIIDQLQLHVKESGTYHIKTVCFTSEGREVTFEDVLGDLDTQCATPTFCVVRPAISNTVVDLSPFGMSIFEDAIDGIKSVDLSYDAIYNEIGTGKLRIFIPDMLVETLDKDGKKMAIPFGRDDDVIYRKVSTTDDNIDFFAPALRTEQQVKAYRTAWQTLGDLCGFGLKYFDVDESGGLKTATEVTSDNSALMRNIRKHENLLARGLAQFCASVLQCARVFDVAQVVQGVNIAGSSLPAEGVITINFDDSIITDTTAEKAQDLAEYSAGLMNGWEYRAKWYAEDEDTAKENMPQTATAEPAFTFDE